MLFLQSVARGELLFNAKLLSFELARTNEVTVRVGYIVFLVAGKLLALFLCGAYFSSEEILALPVIIGG